MASSSGLAGACLHHITLDLQFPTHEQPLCLRFARDHLPKVLVAQTQRHIGLFWFPLHDLTFFFEVYVPGTCLAGTVFKGEGENGIAFLHGVGAFRGRGLEGSVDGVEGEG